MRARDLAQPYPFVTTDDSAVEAVRLLAERSLPALLVLDSDGHPHAIVPGSQLVRQFLPPYVLEHPQLAATVDEQHHTETAEHLARLTVAEWLPPYVFPPPIVGPDAHPMEVAALMARTHSPLVAVIERGRSGVALLGTVTAARLLHHLAGAP